MEKFSFYSLLTILFSGFIFILMINGIYEVILFGDVPAEELKNSITGRIMSNWETLLVASVVVGSAIYAFSFFLVNNWKFIYRFPGLCVNVTKLFYQNQMPSFMYEKLNNKAKEWYGKDIFPENSIYGRLPDVEKENIVKLQGEFYDRMYYELDYEGKLEAAKEFQSIYIFFRNLFISSVIALLLLIVVIIINVFQHGFLEAFNTSCVILSIYIGIFILSIAVAKWFRKRMVSKMYWYFYIHLNCKKSS